MLSLFKKKPEIENLEALRDITDDVIEGDFVPYACHWDPYTIVTENGEVLQTIQITGFTHEILTHADEDSDLRTKIREAITGCIDSTQYAVWIHTVRRKTSLQTQGEYKRDFAGYLNRFWNDRNDWEHKFTNEVYVTVVHEGQNASLTHLKGFVRGIWPPADRANREQFLDAARDELEKVVNNMLPILERYGARRLGIVKRDGIYYSEICRFLGKLITLLDLDFPLGKVDLAHQLTDYDVTFGFNAMEVRMRDTGRRRFGAMLTLREYRELPVEPLDRLLQIPAEFIISQCFDFIHADAALKGFEYQKHLFSVSKSANLAERTGLNDILASNHGKATDFGEHQLGVFILADSLKMLDGGVAKAVGALGSLGMLPMREDIKFEECYWAQLPANFEFVKRLRPINTARLGGFANLNNFPAGSKDGNHWGPAVTTFYTAAHTPYFFNFHDGGNGHTTIMGHPHAGKTVLMNFLLAQARKFDGKLFFFDKNRGSEIFIRSLGGKYYNPYPKADARPYAQVALNPFSLEDNTKNREFLTGFMTALAGVYDDNALQSACAQAVAGTLQRPVGERSVSNCIEALLLQKPEYSQPFARWTKAGTYADVFAAGADTLTLSENIYGFEMGAALKHKETLVPILSYLLYRAELTLTGAPAIIVIDEAWTLLDSPFFSRRLNAWLDMLQQKNALAIFATDQIHDASRSSIGAGFMEHIATQIYLPDEDADATYTTAFGLTEKEISYLSLMNTEDRHFLLKRGDNTIVAELNVAGMDDMLAVLSATPEHLRVMEQMIETHSDAPAQWMPKFLEQI
jgi:type IV secretion system protein VirB4